MAAKRSQTRGSSPSLRRPQRPIPTPPQATISSTRFARLSLVLLGPALLALAGCAGGGVNADSSNPTFSISPGTSSIDTNCTGCNGTNAQGTAVEQFAATLVAGGAATVTWSVTGGDTNTGPGTISAGGQYTPPSYLTADHVQVLVTAAMSKTVTATAVLTLTPGFLQPLSPENAAVPANTSSATRRCPKAIRSGIIVPLFARRTPWVKVMSRTGGLHPANSGRTDVIPNDSPSLDPGLEYTHFLQQPRRQQAKPSV